jgi:hypothetical protein
LVLLIILNKNPQIFESCSVCQTNSVKNAQICISKWRIKDWTKSVANFNQSQTFLNVAVTQIDWFTNNVQFRIERYTFDGLYFWRVWVIYRHTFDTHGTHDCDLFLHAQECFLHVEYDFLTQSVISKRSVILTQKWLRHSRLWFLHAECDFDTYECNYDTHKCDYDTPECYYDTHECDLHTHELNFNTMRVILKRTI